MTSIAIERDVAVPMRDGIRLCATVYRPGADAPHPVIMSVTPYGKDKFSDRLTTFFMRLSGVKFGKLDCSQLTGFESPDPVYWAQQGYAVIQADVRGKYKSEGQAGVLRQQDAEDYYDLIEWAALQPWSTGRVGLMGVSYLCMSHDDAYWASKRPILENIEAPALICASWSDHGLHTRGSIEAFERISSRQK